MRTSYIILEHMAVVRTRVAPSPTGFPHLGLIYQSIFDYVFSHKYDGKFILRIEDTDRSRFVEGAEEVIYKSLEWVGLKPDEGPKEGGDYGPYRQSERLEIYKKYADELIEKGHAYRCFCTKERLEEMRKQQEIQHLAPKYDRTCRNLSQDEITKKINDSLQFTVRMMIPDNQKILVHDEIVGDIEFDSNQIDEQVILKSDGFPTYHLAVVVDDFLMKITHVFRGTEWVPSYPKHYLLWDYLGWKESMPKFIHIPLLLNSEGGGKLSKRHAHTSVDFYRNDGFLPEAVVNYLANIVWNHPEETEIFPMTEFGKAFEADPPKFELKSNGVRFDLQKLEWMNGEYIRAMSDDELAKRIHDYLTEIDRWAKDVPSKEDLIKFIPLIKERIKKLSDFIPLTLLFFERPDFDMSVFKKLKISDYKIALEKILEKLNTLQSPWKSEEFEQTFRGLAEELNISTRDMFQLIRVAVSGQLVTPPLFESIQILGEDETKERLKLAQEFSANS